MLMPYKEKRKKKRRCIAKSAIKVIKRKTDSIDKMPYFWLIREF
jgi:hypothetical protein